MTRRMYLLEGANLAVSRALTAAVTKSWFGKRLVRSVVRFLPLPPALLLSTAHWSYDNGNINAALKILILADGFRHKDERIAESLLRISQLSASSGNMVDLPASTLHRLAEHLKAKDRISESAAFFEAASRMNPRSIVYLINYLDQARRAAQDEVVERAVLWGIDRWEVTKSVRLARTILIVLPRLSDRDFALRAAGSVVQGTGDAKLLLSHATLLTTVGQTGLAVVQALKAIAFDRSESTVLRVAAILGQNSQVEEAVALILEHVHEKPNPHLLWAVGHLLAFDNQPVRALSFLRRAQEIDPCQSVITADLALCCEKQGDVAQAVVLYDLALDQLDKTRAYPSHGFDTLNRNRIRRRKQLLHGARRERELASQMTFESLLVSSLSLPFLTSEGVRMDSWDGRDVVALLEGGVGDEIRYSAIYQRLFSRSSQVYLSCDPRLETLLARSFPEFKLYPHQRHFRRSNLSRATNQFEGLNSYTRSVVPQGLIDPAFSSAIWVRVLAAYDIDSFRAASEFACQSSQERTLIPDDERVNEFLERLRSSCDARHFIGISWRGGHMSYSRNEHYFDVSSLKPLVGAEDVALVNLQYDITFEEATLMQQMFGQRFIELEDVDLKDDFESIAAICAALDVVTAVCTTVLELGAAVGTKTLYLMRAPFATTAIRLLGRGDASGIRNDLVWRACRILPKRDEHDLEYMSRAAACIKDMIRDKGVNS